MKNRERLWDFFLHSYQQGVWCLFVKGPLKCCHQAVICHQVLNTKLTAMCVCGGGSQHIKRLEWTPFDGTQDGAHIFNNYAFSKAMKKQLFCKEQKAVGENPFFPPQKQNILFFSCMK